MTQQWLPGDIRDRIRDLYRAAGMKQSDLADAIGIDKSTLSRFMTGKTDKLSDSNIQKIARFFKVSTDFLLGITEVSDRKNYDVGELGLTTQAARNLFTRKVDPRIVCELLEHPRFADLTHMIAAYKEELFSSGVAVQNQMLSSLSGMVLAQGKLHPEDQNAAQDTAGLLQSFRQPLHLAETDGIQQTFMQILRDMKASGTENAKQTAALTKASMQQITETTCKGENAIDLHTVSPEQIIGGIMGAMKLPDVPEKYHASMAAAMQQFQLGLLQYFTVLEQIRHDEGIGNDQ